MKSLKKIMVTPVSADQAQWLFVLGVVIGEVLTLVIVKTIRKEREKTTHDIALYTNEIMDHIDTNVATLHLHIDAHAVNPSVEHDADAEAGAYDMAPGQ
jgi:hypothetical protein